MGFPSPSNLYVQPRLDIESLVVNHPAATFFLRAETNSMLHAGIGQGDVLVIDRSITPRDGQIVIATLNGEFQVRQLVIRGDSATLAAPDSRIKPVPIDDLECVLWGVVTFSIRQHVK